MGGLCWGTIPLIVEDWWSRITVFTSNKISLCCVLGVLQDLIDHFEKWFSTTCTLSTLRDYRKCKYTLLFPKKTSTQIKSSSCFGTAWNYIIHNHHKTFMINHRGFLETCNHDYMFWCNIGEVHLAPHFLLLPQWYQEAYKTVLWLLAWWLL